MRISKKALIIIAVCFAILIIVLVVFLLNVKPREPEAPRFFIALGDSIPAGFGIEAEENYTSVFYQKLKEEGCADEYINMAENGKTTAMLLEFLNNTDEEELIAFQNAHVITLNIGGNNILLPFLKYMPNIADTVIAVSEIGTIASDAAEVFTEARAIVENFSASDIFRILDVLSEISEILDDAASVFDRIISFRAGNLMPLLLGSFPAEAEIELNEGVNNFSAELKEIIDWLEINAPNATIIINTVYNPLPENIFGIRLEIFDTADRFVGIINDIIFEMQEEKSILVSDVHMHFKNEINIIDVMNFYLDLSSLNFNLDIIHPNSTGHKIIAELNYEAYTASR